MLRFCVILAYVEKSVQLQVRWIIILDDKERELGFCCNVSEKSSCVKLVTTRASPDRSMGSMGGGFVPHPLLAKIPLKKNGTHPLEWTWHPSLFCTWPKFSSWHHVKSSWWLDFGHLKVHHLWTFLLAAQLQFTFWTGTYLLTLESNECWRQKNMLVVGAGCSPSRWEKLTALPP